MSAAAPVGETPISYAQHWEDVRLWRVLHDLEPGFYVDAGAMDPVADSVTKLAYDHGWRGVDVEPHPLFAERLRRARAGDRVVEAAASDHEGELTLHLVHGGDDEDETGLSTVSPRFADVHGEAGMAVESVTVPAVRLDSLLDGTPAEDPARFHFLKVDVEGHEAEALRGAGLDRFRPIVVVIEAREPNAPVDSYAEAEEVLVHAGYAVAGDDGLNRWYVREDRAELGPVLAVEVNPVTDGPWRRHDEVARERALRDRVDELDRAARDLQARLDRALEDAGEQRARADALEERIRAIETSRSWRLTAPLRAAHRAIGREER
jgi:FkbM family methyltransferase